MKILVIAGLLAGAMVAQPGQPQARPLTPEATLIQPVDWYCGPRCRAYRWEQNRRWEQHRRWERERAERYYHNRYNRDYRRW